MPEPKGYNQQIYDYLSSVGANGVGDNAEQFNNYIKDDAYRRQVYDYLASVKAQGIGKDFDEFSSYFGIGKDSTQEETTQAGTPQSRERTGAAPEATKPAQTNARPVADNSKWAVPQASQWNEQMDELSKSVMPGEPITMPERKTREPEVNPFPYRGNSEEARAKAEADAEERRKEAEALNAELEKYKETSGLVDEYESKLASVKKSLDPQSEKTKEDTKWLQAHKDAYWAAKESKDMKEYNRIKRRIYDLTVVPALEDVQEQFADIDREIWNLETGPMNSEKTARKSELEDKKELLNMAWQELMQGSKFDEGYENGNYAKTAVGQFIGSTFGHVDRGSFTLGASEGAANQRVRAIGDKYNAAINSAKDGLGYSDEDVNTLFKSLNDNGSALEELVGELDADKSALDTMESTYNDMVKNGASRRELEEYAKKYDQKVKEYNQIITEKYQPLAGKYEEEKGKYDQLMAAIDESVAGKLTDGEREILKAYETLINARALSDEFASTAAKSGAGFEQTLEFMVDFWLTKGLDKAGAKAATKIATNRAIKKFGAGAVKKMTIRPGIGAKMATDLGVSVARTAALPTRFAQSLGEQLTQIDPVMKDELGRYQFSRSHENAWANTGVENFIEYWSEGFGEYFSAAERALFKNTMSAAPKTMIGQTLRRYKGSIGNYLDNTKFNGQFNETVEEVIGSGLNSLAGWLSSKIDPEGPGVGDKEALNEFFKKENLATLTVSFMPLSAVSAATNMSAYHQMRSRYNKAVEGLNPFLKSGAVSREELESLSKNLPNMTPEEVTKKIEKMADNAREFNEGHLPDDFVQNIMGYLEGSFSMSLRNDEWEESREKMAVVNAYSSTYSNPDARYAWDLDRQEQEAKRAALAAGFTEEELEQDSYILAQEAAQMRESEPERSQVLEAYATAKSSSSGLQNGYDAETRQIAEAYEQSVRSNVDNGGQVMTAKINLNGAAAPVFIVSEDATVGADGTVTTPTGPDGIVKYKLFENGEVKTAKASEFSDATSVSTDDYIASENESFENRRAEYFEQQKNTMSLNGMSDAMSEMVGRTVVVDDNSGVYEPFKVERMTDDGTEVVISGDKKALQRLARRMNLPIPPSKYLKAPVAQLYPLLATESDGSLTTDIPMNPTKEQAPAAPAETETQAAETQEQGLGDIVDKNMTITVNGEQKNVHVLSNEGGWVIFEELDADGNVERTSTLKEDQFADAMQAAPATLSRTEELLSQRKGADVSSIVGKEGAKMTNIIGYDNGNYQIYYDYLENGERHHGQATVSEQELEPLLAEPAAVEQREESGEYGPVISTFDTNNGTVEVRTKTSEKDGVKTTKVVATRNGSEVATRGPQTTMPVPEGFALADVPEGAEVVGISELRESQDGTRSATALVRLEDGSYADMESRLVEMPEIPLDENGEKIYDAPGVSVEDALEDLYKTDGLSEEDVDNFIAERAAAAEAARNPERGSMSPQAWGQAKKEAARIADFWSAMRQAAEQRKAAAEAPVAETPAAEAPVQEEPVQETTMREEQPVAEQEPAQEATAEETTTEEQEAPATRQERRLRRALDKKLKQWEKRTGFKVRVINSYDEVTRRQAKEALDEGRPLTGWYNPDTNQVEIYMPNIDKMEELDKTFIHEVVSHRGLRGLLGEQGYNELCDRVWNELMTEGDKKKWIGYNRHLSSVGEAQRRAAADEYIANLSEGIDFDDNRSIFEKIVDWIREMLGDVLSIEDIETDASERAKDARRMSKKTLENILIDSMKRYEATTRSGQEDAENRREIGAGVKGGSMQTGEDSDGQTRFSVKAITTGGGLDVIEDNGKGMVAFTTSDGRVFDAEHPISAAELRGLEDTVMAYMMKDARTYGGLRPELEDRIWIAYADQLNAFLQKGVPDNGLSGADRLKALWEWEVENSVYRSVSPNGDAQYSYSIDITRVCKKNEAVIKAISSMQRTLGYGITPGQIMDIYMSGIEEGYQVPCPVCYVFSRYIRNGMVASVAINGQQKYGKYLVDPSTLTEKQKQERIKFWKKELKKQEAENKKNANAITKAKQDCSNIIEQIDTLSELITSGRLQGEDRKKALRTIKALDNRYRSAFKTVSQSALTGWIKQFAIHESKDGFDPDGEGKTYELWDDTFQGFPDEYALDLRLTAETIEKYPAIQRLRNARGSAGGKEIHFASNNDIGDIPMMLGSGNKDNYYQMAAKAETKKQRDKYLRAATKRFKSAHKYAQQQSLRGGQRMWSWSDNIERLGPDVFVNLAQLQMLGGALQAYSKQLEGVNLVATMGGYVNGSLMGYGKGWTELNPEDIKVVDGKEVLAHDIVDTVTEKTPSGEIRRNRFLAKAGSPVIDVNGKKVTLLFDDVVGIDAYGREKDGHHLKGLFDLNGELDKAGNILVGMNDTHVIAAMADDRVFFIIPWHASGNSVHIVQQMLSYLGVDTDIKDYTDYTNVQEEKDATKKKSGKEEVDEEELEEISKETEENEAIRPELVEFWEKHKNEKDFKCGLGTIPSGKDGQLSDEQKEYRELRNAIFLGVKVDTGRKNKKGQTIYKTVSVREIPEMISKILPDPKTGKGGDEFLAQVLRKVESTVDDGFMTNGDTKFIYPYEYWDESSTYKTADVNGARYLEYCRRMGYKPKFVGKLDSKAKEDFGNFADYKGYWKLLIDRRMYDVNGNFQDLTPTTTERYHPSLVDPEWTEQNFPKTTVADDLGAERIAARAIEKERGTFSGKLPSADYGSNLENAVKEYNAVLEATKKLSIKDLVEAAKPENAYAARPVDEGGTMFREVTDPAKIAELEAEKKVPVYRSALFVPDPNGDVEYDLGDGNGKQKGFLYPPMSVQVDGKFRAPLKQGSYDEAEERPDLADENGKFELIDDNGKPMKVAYAPYLHNRVTPLNEQFSAAYRRNLVVIRSLVPESELKSNYTAEKSKKSTGEHDWPSGSVSNALAKEGMDTRKVILSRWAKIGEPVPYSEVADEIARLIGDRDLAFEYNVVSPGLRKELVKRGIRFEGWHGNKPNNVDELIAGMKAENDAIASTRFREAASNLYDRYENQNGEDKPWMSEGELIDRIEEELPYGLETKELFAKIDEYRRLDEEDFNEGRRDFSGSERDNVFQEILSSLKRLSEGESAGTRFRERITPEQDAEYMDAVNSGDMEKAQEMVDAAAKAAGYNSPRLYHGSDAFGFTSIDTNRSDDGASFWATDKEDVAGSYTKLAITRKPGTEINDDDYDKAVAKANDALDDGIREFRHLIDKHFSEWFFGQQGDEGIRKVIMDANHEPGYGDGVYDILEDYVAEAYADYGEDFKDEYEDFADWEENSPEAQAIFEAVSSLEGLRNQIWQLENGELSGGIYELYSNTDNMFVVNAKGKAWNELHPEGLPKIVRGQYKDVPYRTRDVVKWAKENGYDGVIFKNIRDNGRYGRTEPSDVYAFLNPQAQVKSADPITYDDNGDVIPLSERFNPENNDIRFRESSTGNAQADYENEIRSRVTQFLLEWQDGDIPVRTAMNKIMNELGITHIDEDADYLTRHNLVSSRADAQMHQYKLFYFEPMMKTVSELVQILSGGKPTVVEKLTGRNKEKQREAYKQVVDFCYAMSGLERNAWKRAEAEELKKQTLEKLAEKFQKKKDDIYADSRLSDEEKDKAVKSEESSYQRERKIIEEKYADRDYSGITALMGRPKEEWMEAEQDAQEMIDSFRDKVNNNGLIDELWDRIRACTDFNLEHAYKYGLLTRAEFEKLHGTESQKRLWNYYIPLRGFAERTAEDEYEYSMFTSDASGGDVVKAAKGRTTVADDPFATMRHISELELVQGLNNWAKQALYNFVLRAGNNSLLSVVEPWYVKEPGTDKWIAAEPNEGESLEHFEKRMQEAYEKRDARKGRNGLKLGLIMANTMHRNQHMIRLKVNGQDKMIWVNGSPILAQAVNGVQGWNNRVVRGIQAVNRALSQFYTTYSLKFLSKNKMRDTQFSRIAALVDEGQAYLTKLEKNWWANNGYVAGGYPMIKLVSAWESGELEKKKNRTEREQLFIDFMYDGGATGYTVMNSMDKIKRDLERMVSNAGRGERNIPIIDWYAKGVGALNEASELLTRFTFYQTSREMGRSRERAAYDAKESSVNFNRRGLRSGVGVAGWTAAAAGVLYLFMNPAIQGLEKFVRLHKSHPWRMGLVDATYFMMGFVNSMLNAMIAGASDGGDGDDDDEKMGPDWYWNIPEWVRRGNMIIGSPFKKLGKWGYLVISLPIEYKGFYAMGELASALVQRKYAAKDAPTIANEVVGVVSELLPINPVEGYTPGDNVAMSVVRNMMPDIAAPIMDIATNRSFAGIPLWKENIYDETEPLSQSAFASTPELLNKAVIKLSEVTSDMPWHVDIPSGAVRGLLKGYGGGGYNFVEDMGKIVFADEAHPRRYENFPIVSGFTGYLEEDRRDSYNSEALKRYKALSKDVVRRIRSAAPGEEISESMVYNTPDSLPQNARVTKLLHSDEWKLGEMYYHGMKERSGEKEAHVTKNGDVRTVDVKDDINSLRKAWKEAKDKYIEIAKDKKATQADKDAAEKAVQKAWLKFASAEDALAEKLLQEEYDHVSEKIKNGIPYQPKETLSEKAYKLMNRK